MVPSLTKRAPVLIVPGIGGKIQESFVCLKNWHEGEDHRREENSLKMKVILELVVSPVYLFLSPA